MTKIKNIRPSLHLEIFSIEIECHYFVNTFRDWNNLYIYIYLYFLYLGISIVADHDSNF